jgi:hypothetical protein
MITTRGAEVMVCGSPWDGLAGSAEDDGAGTVEKDAVLALPANGARQCEAFGVLADGGKGLRMVRVVDPDDFLFDDRAFSRGLQ